MTLLSLARYFREKRVNGRFLSFVSFAQPVFLCEIMQLAAFLCVICAICGRIFTQEYSSNLQKENNKSLADPADNRRQTPKFQNGLNLKLSVFLCEIMQLAAFLCEICVICWRIFTWEYSINSHKLNPNVSRRSRRLRRQTTKPQITLTPICLSLRNNTTYCIPLRDLRNLRENNHARLLKQSAQTPHNKSPADNRRRNLKQH